MGPLRHTYSVTLVKIPSFPKGVGREIMDLFRLLLYRDPGILVYRDILDFNGLSRGFINIHEHTV